MAKKIDCGACSPQLARPVTLQQNAHSCHDGRMKQDMDVHITSASPPELRHHGCRPWSGAFLFVADIDWEKT